MFSDVSMVQFGEGIVLRPLLSEELPTGKIYVLPYGEQAIDRVEVIQEGSILIIRKKKLFISGNRTAYVSGDAAIGVLIFGDHDGELNLPIVDMSDNALPMVAPVLEVIVVSNGTIQCESL